ncbi:DUF4386 domain-containing protein [Burkholderiaceae bacterium FT117]|uniref:DUF4386 domain-containing protein n=1 Tax=Zeimonas sediminis TaxID=2944268 RepID=UPI002342F64E|nr:DUF4386 domain-containing protein [Zeimonas sediminis]MCM5569350.1 DUF4386 domain-containing protein [Zeimonas sediminis]
MTDPATAPGFRPAAGLAGALYLVIIVAGVWSEAAVRAPLLAPDDPASVFAGLQTSLGMVRASIAADTVMLIADVALAVLLFRLLRTHGPALALAAMAFRLMQAAVLGANLLNLQAAVLLAEDGRAAVMLGDGAAALATLRLQAHAHGYDLGLAFFGVNAVLTGVLLLRSRWAPRALGLLVTAAGGVYLAGSGVRLLAPGLSATFGPAYALPLLAESAFCLWLLWVSLRRGAPPARVLPSR